MKNFFLTFSRIKIGIFIIFFLLSSRIICSPEESSNQALKIANSWLAGSLKLIKQTPGYSPPVAARTMAYLSIGMGVISSDEKVRTAILDKTDIQLNLVRLDPNLKKYNAEILNEFLYLLVLHFYENMPQESLKKTNELLIDNRNGFLKHSKKEERIIHKTARIICEDFLNQINLDGGEKSWNKNFPKYVITKCDSCWVPTYPGFVDALQPFWGSNKVVVRSNRNLCDSLKCFLFSVDTNSILYKEAYDMLKLYDTIQANQKNIAEHWDDSPGVSGTPVGHLYKMALKLSEGNNFDLQKTLNLYIALGIALNDAVIECWRLKYEFNFIRPISYINRYINKDFKPVLVTPPFPEFPSGHSFQAGAALEVFKFFFDDNTLIVDDTNVDRKDIKGKTYTYHSFTEMCNEMSLSRYYGGIHYLKTLELSREYGRKFGSNTLTELFF
ncbi:MAG: vanadium-dependent haloperoxidase [Flavobacteriales bacterium]|nr:vanadium-dependent haloperoxidase [Flavobacteriales bacterium]